MFRAKRIWESVCSNAKLVCLVVGLYRARLSLAPHWRGGSCSCAGKALALQALWHSKLRTEATGVAILCLAPLVFSAAVVFEQRFTVFLLLAAFA